MFSPKNYVKHLSASAFNGWETSKIGCRNLQGWMTKHGNNLKTNFSVLFLWYILNHVYVDVHFELIYYKLDGEMTESVVDGFCSSVISVDSGVPQMSVLRPILFFFIYK